MSKFLDRQSTKTGVTGQRVGLNLESQETRSKFQSSLGGTPGSMANLTSDDYIKLMVEHKKKEEEGQKFEAIKQRLEIIKTMFREYDIIEENRQSILRKLDSYEMKFAAQQRYSDLMEKLSNKNAEKCLKLNPENVKELVRDLTTSEKDQIIETLIHELKLSLTELEKVQLKQRFFVQSLNKVLALLKTKFAKKTSVSCGVQVCLFIFNFTQGKHVR
jgi:hypothetical protein